MICLVTLCCAKQPNEIVFFQLSCKIKPRILTKQTIFYFPTNSVEKYPFTMDLDRRIEVFAQLGQKLSSSAFADQRSEWVFKATNSNNWFTEENVQLALENICKGYLEEDSLRKWTKHYGIGKATNPQKVGLILAGNIPAVGFHDLLCVLISGNTAMVKFSSQDFVLIKEIIKLIIEIEPSFANKIILTERMNDVDAMIATGSDNTARYFEYYFRNKPHLIRKNRVSVGILNGNEDIEELNSLGNDILTYFGLGCRNVSKLYVPENYVFTPFFEAIEPLGDVILHHKYKNNYDYNKAILLVNQDAHLDNGFLLLKADTNLVSPIGVCFVESYQNEADLTEKLSLQANKIQCIVSQNGWYSGSLHFGKTQQPQLWDYADGVDTMAFLLSVC